MVSRPRRWQRAPVGARAGDQTADAARIVRAADHVVSRDLEFAVPAERRGGRDADCVPSSGAGTDSRRTQARDSQWVEIYARASEGTRGGASRSTQGRALSG